jgi:hypothetical protein
MKNCNAPESKTTRRILPIACAAALGMAFTVSLAQAAHAAPIEIVVPPVPPNLEVDAGFKPFLVGHAFGTQNYVCSKSGAGVKYVLFTPEATLFSDDGTQIITHYFSPNPDPSDPNTSATVVADGAIRATWQDKDTSTIWAKLHVDPIKGPGSATMDRNAIAWLLLDVVGAEVGPTGGDKLTPTKFVQRLSTQGGLQPSTGCSSLDDAGNQAFMPYTADYFFYKHE